MDHPPSITQLDDTLRRVFGDRLGRVTLNGWSVSWLVRVEWARINGDEIEKVCRLLDVSTKSLEFWPVKNGAGFGYGSNAIEFSCDLDEATPLARPTRKG